MSVRLVFSLCLALAPRALFSMENTSTTMEQDVQTQAVALGNLVSKRPQQFVEKIAPFAKKAFENDDLHQQLALKKLCDAHIDWHRGDIDSAGKNVVKAVALLNHL